MKLILLISTLLTTLCGSAQELPLFPEFDKSKTGGGVGLSYRSLKGGNQIFIPSVNYRYSEDRTLEDKIKNISVADRQFFVGTSINGLTFNEEENKITFGLKVSFLSTRDNPYSDRDMYVIGHDVDINSQYTDCNSRLQRSIYFGDKVVFDHGVSFGAYRENGLIEYNQLDSNFVSFTGGPELGLRSLFKVGKKGSLNLSLRSFFHILPSVNYQVEPVEILFPGEENELYVYESNNGVRLQNKFQINYLTSNFTIFAATRNEFVKIKSYYKNLNQFTLGAQFNLKGTKKNYKKVDDLNK